MGLFWDFCDAFRIVLGDWNFWTHTHCFGYPLAIAAYRIYFLKLFCSPILSDSRRSAGQTANEYKHIYGDMYITEIVHGLKFRISPGSFFQVGRVSLRNARRFTFRFRSFQINTQSAEVLYQCAINLAETTPQTSVLDICCGTGTIGLCFAKVRQIDASIRLIFPPKRTNVLRSIAKRCLAWSW